MKKILFTMLLVVATAGSTYADPTKMDGLLKIMKATPETGKAFLGKAITIKAGRELISCLLKSSDPDLTATAIEEAGGEVRAVLGEIMSVSIPSDIIDAISNREEVLFIEAAKPMTTKMNEARTFTHVVEVQNGTGLDKAYNGSNVLVGVVDQAIDWENADFQDTAGKTRICYIFDNSSGTIVECTKSSIDDASCKAPKGGSGLHGTHVTGIASSSNSTYTGVAPEAFIAFAFNLPSDPDTSGTEPTSFSTTVLEGVSAIFKKADDLSLPAVINLSLGTSIGAHDNTSLLEEGLNSAVSGKKGRVIVDAAGNEDLPTNDPSFATLGGIHAAFNVSAGTDNGWKVAIRTPLIGNYSPFAVVDVWLANTTQCQSSTIEVKAYPRNVSNLNTANAAFSTSPIDFNNAEVNTATQKSSDNKVQVDVFTSKTNSLNNRPEGIVHIMPTNATFWSAIASATDPNAGYFFDVIIRVPSGACKADMWLYPDYTTLLDFTKQGGGGTPVTGTGGYQPLDGDSLETMTIPGTADGVITAGSYMGRGTWTDENGNVHNQTDFDEDIGATGGTVNKISLFSSLGPTGDGRKKPDLVAPGEPIISTAASADAATLDPRIMGDPTHVKLEGSSMSSPHVAGAVALMLQKNNCLTASDVKGALTSTAVSFPDQTVVPDNTYGFGNVNALAAMQAISGNTSCYSGTTCGGGGGGGGGGGCSATVLPVSASTGIISLLFLAVPFGILVIRRRKK